jgi:hypothetical protein
MNLDQIIDNIDQYEDNIDDLVRSLKAVGVASFEEFKQAIQAAGVPVKRSLQNAVQDKFENAVVEDWAEAQALNTEEAYMHFLGKYPTSEYVAEAREKVAQLIQERAKNQEHQSWNALDKRNEDALRKYISENPSSPYVAEAASILRELENRINIADFKKELRTRKYDKSAVVYQRIKSVLDAGHITTYELLEAIRENNNIISVGVVKSLIAANYISRNDLRDVAMIPIDVIEKICNNDVTESQQPIANIPMATMVTLNPCTEVYFWGIPSSGKTCAMGAIMSTVKDGVTVNSCEFINKCQGYFYMTYLAGGFRQGEVRALPPGTGTGATYEMGMNLSNENNDTYPVTCIDLAGETITSMFKSDVGMELTGVQENTLAVVRNMLCDNRTKNRKKHFFVIEYGAENRTYEGRDQDECLRGAVNYIKSSGIFKNDTDGVYILITKVDETGLKGEALIEKLRDYIRTHYQGFYNNLKKLCEDYEINGGEVIIQPFSLGEVYFNYYCRFDNTYAADVASVLMSGYCIKNESKFWRFLKR